MNCKSVLRLIDTLPMTQWRPTQIEAVERHARDCAECRLLLEAAEALDSGLRELAEPAPPPALAAAVASRIAHPVEPPAAGASNRLAWATALAGVTIGLGALAYGLLVLASQQKEIPQGLRDQRVIKLPNLR